MASPLTLGPDWTIAQASLLHQQLLEALLQSAEAGEQPVLDLGSVESMDSAGVQLLLALRRSLQERGQDLIVRGASAAVRSALDVYHLTALLLPPEFE